MSDWDDSDYDRPARSRRYSCGGYASYTGHCGASDCSTCNPGGDPEDSDETEGEWSRTKVVTARKARNAGKPYEIRPGDRVRIEYGFTYEVNGPRTGYFKRRTLLAKGPAWCEAVATAAAQA